MPEPLQMIPVMPSYSPTNITTEQIQKYLDENKKLILAILDNQNLGKLAECAQYQALLQKNLMCLAAIADAQPPSTPTMAPQMVPHPAMQPGGYAAAAMIHQSDGMYPQKVPFQLNNPHQMQDPQPLLQHQQAMQGQMGIRTGGPHNGMHPLHVEAGGAPPSSGTNDGYARNKQEGFEAGANGQGPVIGGHGGGDRAEEGK